MIEAVNKQSLNELLPLIRKYQEFYKVTDIDDKHNYLFFSQFGLSSSKGCLFAYKKDEQFVAFATIYFSYASSIISKVGILNDLFTLEEYRQQGIAKELIVYCEKYAKSKGAKRLQWLTSSSNKTALKVYQSLGVAQSSWQVFTYSSQSS